MDRFKGAGHGTERDYGVAPLGYRLPSDTRVGAVTLQVADVTRSEEYYDGVLGLKKLAQDGGITSLGLAGSGEVLVQLVEHPGAVPLPPRGRIGLFHFAVLVPDRQTLGSFAAHVRRLGLNMGMADHLVSEALYLSDPDGLGIEVYVDRPQAEWQRSGRQLVMKTDPLDIADLISRAGSLPFSKMPDGTKMGHVHFHVGQLDSATRFYHEGLGLDKIVWDYPGALFLSAGGYHHHVGINTWAPHAIPAGPDDARLLSWMLVLPSSLMSKGQRRISNPPGTASPATANAWLPRILGA